MIRESWRINNELSVKLIIFSADEINKYYCSFAENAAMNISTEEDPTIKNIVPRQAILGRAMNFSSSTRIFPECLKITVMNPSAKEGDCDRPTRKR